MVTRMKLYSPPTAPAVKKEALRLLSLPALGTLRKVNLGTNQVLTSAAATPTIIALRGC